MGVRKLRKICIYILAIFLLFSPIVVFDYFNNEKIEKEIKIDKNNKLKPLDQEGETYRLVTSADNVQVPVPKGYVASGVTGENYVTPEYSYTTITHKISSTPTELTWSSPAGEPYPWTQDENGIWISGNQGIPDSESVLESEEFDYIKGTTLTINYTYSCKGGDYLDVDLIDLTNNITQRIIKLEYGNTSTPFDYTISNYTYTMDDWATGRYKLRAIYSKNASGDYGQDSGYIKTSTYFKEDVNGELLEIKQKTKVHDGGFVIYQLTDEEIETNPNGTNVIINDTNKDRAQSERNQYVWVPISNIEDIVRTKTVNNGILQFGQEYIFSNTSIDKETRTGTSFYREPRIEKYHDTTKYYLQKYLNIEKNRESFLNNMQKDYTNMLKSINKYKGLYIGRYETGDEHSHYSRICFINPKVIRYNGNISKVTWYNSYKELERLAGKTEKYVETGMLYDSLFDHTLKWLKDTDTRSYKDIAEDSGTWGNYSNNIKTITSGNTEPSTTGAIETIHYKGETFNDSPTSSNNIFDIAGNVYEWTRSTDGVNVRRFRGGCYTNTGIYNSASIVFNNYPSDSMNYVGTRAQLYIL